CHLHQLLVSNKRWPYMVVILLEFSAYSFWMVARTHSRSPIIWIHRKYFLDLFLPSYYSICRNYIRILETRRSEYLQSRRLLRYSLWMLNSSSLMDYSVDMD